MKNNKISAYDWWKSLSTEEQGLLWQNCLSKFENEDQYIELLFSEFSETSKTNTKNENKY